MKGILGLARYGTAQVAAATVAAAWMLLVIVVVYLGLLARVAYRMLAQGAAFSLPLWPLVTGLVGLLAVVLILAPACALADWIFRRKAAELSRSKLVLSLAIVALAAGLASWGAMLRWDLPMLPFLGVVAALMAPGFAM